MQALIFQSLFGKYDNDLPVSIFPNTSKEVIDQWIKFKNTEIDELSSILVNRLKSKSPYFKIFFDCHIEDLNQRVFRHMN